MLAKRHLRMSLAEDLVQEALSRWINGKLVHRTDSQTRSWLGRAMDRIAKEWSIRSHDPLDQHPDSLDAPWATAGGDDGS